MTKACTGCRVEKSVDDFYPASRFNRAQGREYLAQCKVCVRVARKRRYETPEGRRYAHEFRLRDKFGIDLERYHAMEAAQDGRCAICLEPETATRNGRIKILAVDHDHETDVVRGLLCTRCNTALGLLRENPELIRRAASYLDR